MDKFVTSANIKHYRELLTIEADEHRRQQLCRLLVEEETKLEAALKKEKEKKMTFVIDPTFRRPMITAELVRH